jgi:hypothetical protein
MSEPEVNGDTIKYTVKELLAEIREGITAIKSVSAQHELRLQRVEMTVADHGMQLGSAAPQIAQLAKIIETQAEVKDALADDRSSAFNRRDKLVALGFAALTVGVNAFGIFHH